MCVCVCRACLCACVCVRVCGGAQVHGPRTTEESFRYRGLPVLADMVAEAVRGSDALCLYRAHHVVTLVRSTCHVPVSHCSLG